jgi:hypothetical protein
VIGLDGVSAQALSDTIGAIYDCALEPRWGRSVSRGDKLHAIRIARAAGKRLCAT